MPGRTIELLLALPLVMIGCVSSAPKPAADSKPVYIVEAAVETPALEGNWRRAAWRRANTLEATHFLPHSTEGLPDSGHRPVAQARVLYDEKGLYVHFRVKDKYVRSIATEYRGRVWEDAAVEFFVQPKLHRGYFNFETNCGGTMLLSYHEHPEYKGPVRRKPGGVPWELASSVVIHHSMPEVVDPEIAEDVVWQNEYFIPFELLEAYVGPLGDLAGREWRANFYKIAETNSHPHFASWSPILEGVNFHSPEFFGVIRFAPGKH